MKQDIGYNYIAAGVLLLTNRHLTLDLSDYRLHYEVRCDGEVVASDELPPVTVSPGATKEIDVSAATASAKNSARAEQEVMLTFKLKLKEDAELPRRNWRCASMRPKRLASSRQTWRLR